MNRNYFFMTFCLAFVWIAGSLQAQFQLDVDGSIRATNGGIFIYDGNQGLSLSGNAAEKYIHLDVGGAGHSDDDIYIGDRGGGNTNKVVMLGNVGIGTATPSTKLDVVGGISASEGGSFEAIVAGRNGAGVDYPFQYETIGVNSGLVLRLQSPRSIKFHTNISDSEPQDESKVRMVIADEGNVGIGTTAPQAKIHVNGTVRLENLPTGSGDAVTIDANGNLFRSVAGPNLNSEVITQLQRENEILQIRLEQLEEIVQSMVTTTDVHQNPITLTPTTAELKQNQPNPFNGQTTIPYFLPESTQKAQIQINDINGKVLRIENIENVGHGVLNLDAKALPQGTYSYSLIVDGQLVETKQMILVK